MFFIATTTLIFITAMPVQADFSPAECASGVLCVRLAESPVGDGRVDSESVDLVSGQAMRTRWLAAGVMARTIWTAGVPACVRMEGGPAGIAETPDVVNCLTGDPPSG